MPTLCLYPVNKYATIMKTLLRSGFILLFALLVCNVSAQERGGRMQADPETQATRQLEQLKGIVKVNQQEATKIQELFLKAAKERQKAFEEIQQSGNRENMRDKMQEMNKKRDEELRKILGDKRMDKYLAELEKQRQQRGQRDRRF